MGISAFNGGISPSGSNLIKAPAAVSGRRWAALGDSISANAGITGTRIPPSNGFRQGGNSLGYQGWLMALSLGEIDIQPDANFSIAGNTTAQIAARVPQVIAYRPSWCIVAGGTNDPGGSIPVAQTIANLKGIYDALNAAGIGILAICVTPRGGGTAGNYTTAQLQNISRINQFIRRYAALLPAMVVADPARSTFLSQSTNLPTAAQSLDGLHPNQAGAKSWGQVCLTAVSPFVQTTDTSYVCYDANDTYDSVNNQAGNMILNGLFTTASGGTLTGNSLLTGTAPSHWTVIMTKADAAYTGTIVLSNGSRTDATVTPGNLATITAASLVGTVTGGPQDHVQFFQQINFPTGLVAGDEVEAMVEIFVNATAGLSGLDINLSQTDGNGTTYSSTGFGVATNSAAFPQGTYHLVIKTPRMLIAPTAGVSTRLLSASMDIYADTTPATGTATFVVSIASFSVRKINGLA